MTVQAHRILHQGLRRLWLTHGLDNTGISITWANFLREALAVMDGVKCGSDLAQLSEIMNVPVLPYPGKNGTFTLAIVRDWRLVFCLSDEATGLISALDIEHWPDGKAPPG